MRYFLIFLALALLPADRTGAQGENNICTFSTMEAGQNTAINFNTNPPSITGLPPTGYGQKWSSAVCNASGQLRFMVRLSPNVSWGSYPNILRPDGTPVPGSDLKTGLLTESCMPLVIPHPGNPDQYYIFYTYSKGLLYTILDMSLNGGTGGIVAGQKDVSLSAYGTVIGKRMVAVKGCGGVWLVIHSNILNGFYSFLVDQNGLHTEAVTSGGGNFSQAYHYGYDDFGFLKASPDGSMLACSGWEGLELFDFEPCSGRVKNARVLEATGNGNPFSGNVGETHTRFHGLCFSPGGTKLYVTQNYRYNGITEAGRLFQYNLSLSGLPAIINSKTSIIENPPCLQDDISGQCIVVGQNPLGEIKAGPDGKLYIDNGSYTCQSYLSVPPGFNPGPAFHTVQQPDIAGTSCQPILNTIIVESYTGTAGASFAAGGSGGYSHLQQDIVTADPSPDTVPGNIFPVYGCFRDSLVLEADSTGSCFHWGDDFTGRKKGVYRSGLFFVTYTGENCKVQTDTFNVHLVPLPKLSVVRGSCSAAKMGTCTIAFREAMQVPVSYTWRASDGSILRNTVRAGGDTLNNINPGTYEVTLSADGSCDTTLSFNIPALPLPTVQTAPQIAMIHYGDSVRLHASGAAMYTWSPVGPLDTATKPDPLARPLQATTFSVIGIAANGCRDTGYVHIDIDYSMPFFLPNAFSPNGDGINDIFEPRGLTYQKVTRFSIYNRHGQELFRISAAGGGWDGTHNGSPCDMGTYFYLLDLALPDGTVKQYKGDVTLLR